jgi:hypothetical protein
MATQTLAQTLQQTVRTNQGAIAQQQARAWLQETTRGIGSFTINASGALRSSDSLTTRIEIGKMYLFEYDPKTKDLPYHDRFPLIFPFAAVKDGFYGINMHYLPHMMRAKLMDALLSLTSDTKLTAKTQLTMSYSILSKASRFAYFRPCIKHYLNNQVRSRFLEVPAPEWKRALFLPLEQFVGASKQRVYQDSRRMIRGL